MSKFKLGSLFSGIGGFELVGQMYGIEPVWASEIEEAPIRITKRHFPNMKHLGDITAINGAEIEPVDVLTGGSPCFPAGTLILTDKGYVDIKDIKVGDTVLTHMGRWREVTAVGSNPDEPIYCMDAMGTYSVSATPNHPFLVVTRVLHEPNINGKRVRKYEFTEPYKKRMDELVPGKDFLCSPILPESNETYDLTTEMTWLLGRYVADGHVDKAGNVILSIGNTKISQFDNITEPYKQYKHGESCVRMEFRKTKSKLYSYIERFDMNRSAIDKYIPMEILMLPTDLLKSFIDGYMAGDGCYIAERDYYQATSISKMLILTLQLAIQKVYRTAVKVYYTERPETYNICGRTVNQHDTYMVRYSETIKKQKNYYVTDSYILYPIRSVTNTNTTNRVYNMTVDEDHSYLIPTLFVGNCQDLSVAGNQKGISKHCPECGYTIPADSDVLECPKCGAEIEFTRSGLFMEQIRIIKEMREKTNGKYPRFVIWENVRGAFSSNNGDDFYCVLREFCSLLGEELPTLRPPQWTTAGEILGASGSLAWRTFDAQYWGVPQRRSRIYLVTDFGGQRAGEILFKSESLRRHTPQGEVPWKRTSGKAKGSIGRSDEQRNSNTGAGSGNGAGVNPPLCVATSQANAEICIDKAPTLTAAAGTSGDNKPYVCMDSPEVYGLCSLASNCMKSDNPDSGCYKADVSKTLDTNGLNPMCNQGGNVVVEAPVYCIQGNCIDRADTAGCNGKGWKEDVAFTLTTIDRPAVVYGVHEGSGGECNINEEVCNCMTTGGGKPGQGYPCVLIEEDDKNCAAFLGKQGSDAGNIGYSETVSPTLVAGNPPNVAEYEKHSAGFAHQQGPGVPNFPYYDEQTPPLTCSQKMAVFIENHPADSRVKISEDNVCQTLSARMGTGGGNVPLVMETDSKPEESKEPIVMGSTGSFMYWDEGISGTLCRGDFRQNNKVVMVDTDPNTYAVTDCSHTDIGVNVSPPLAARDYKASHIISRPLKSIVRRLTCVECERLQGFPCEWTAGESDAARYKALGNSVALPNVSYVMSGIIDALDPEVTT